MTDTNNAPNQYVQRANRFNRPHRTGNVNSEKNNYNASFNQGVHGGDNNPNMPYTSQPTPQGISEIVSTQREAQTNSVMPTSAPQEAAGIQSPMQNVENVKPPIGVEEVRKAASILEKYKQGKQRLEDKIVRNDKWWKLRHWELMETEETRNDPKPASAWLFNTIISKHADYMDSFPTSDILPREQGDKEEAQRLSSIIPVIMEQNGYKRVFSDEVWYKLKHGTGVYGVFWDKSKLNGLGDISIESMDLLQLFWEPGVTDIQKSSNFFSVELVDNSILEAQYPQLQGKLKSTSENIVKKYWFDENIDTQNKSAVIDWYYHKIVNGKKTLQYVKFVSDEVLYATENDNKRPTAIQNQPVIDETGAPVYDENGIQLTEAVEVVVGESMAESGLYDHAKYPFVFDPLYPEAGMPIGFGLIDVCKNPQASIDIFNNCFEKNVQFVCSPRYIVRNDGGINEEEFADPNKLIVHTDGNLAEDSMAPINTPMLVNSNYISILDHKITEMKETAGNRDATTGGTTAGVTAASAIAAIQESAGKTSRDQIANSYEAHKDVVYLVIELIRQFYDMPRQFRITGENGQAEFTQYTNEGLKPQYQGVEFGVDMGYRLPVFDIDVKAEKESAYTQLSQNELALQFYNQGFFNPQYTDQALVCLDMMDFHGKDALVSKITQNGTLYQKLLQLQQQMLQMAQMIDNLTDNQYNMAESVSDAINENLNVGVMSKGGDISAGNVGDESTVTKNARERASNATAPR